MHMKKENKLLGINCSSLSKEPRSAVLTDLVNVDLIQLSLSFSFCIFN